MVSRSLSSFSTSGDSYVAGSGEIESSNSSQDSRLLLGGSSLKSRGPSGAQKKIVKWSESLLCFVCYVLSSKLWSCLVVSHVGSVGTLR